MSSTGSWDSLIAYRAPTLHNQVEVQGTEEIVPLIRSSTEPALLKSAGSVELLISGTISSVP